MSQSLLVTGSSGFIGTKLVRTLKSAGNDVLEVSRSTSKVDVTDWNLVRKLPKKDCVVHLAGFTNITTSFNEPREVYDANILGTLNILELCRLNKISNLIFISTYVYGIPDYLPVDEKHPVRPGNPYSRSKYLGEQLCEGYCRDYGMNITALRLFNVYGPGQSENFLVSSVMNQLISGKVNIRDPLPKRDFVYIDDVVDAIIKAARSELKGFEVVNIGSGESFRVSEIVDMISGLYRNTTGNEVSVNYAYNERRNEVQDTIANISKARTLLGWHPKTDIITGLSETMKAYINERSR